MIWIDPIPICEKWNSYRETKITFPNASWRDGFLHSIQIRNFCCVIEDKWYSILWMISMYFDAAGQQKTDVIQYFRSLLFHLIVADNN